MAAFKARIIEKILQRIKSADPPLRKFDLGLTGRNGDVTGASDEGIAARLSTDQRELHPWSKLRETAAPQTTPARGRERQSRRLAHRGHDVACPCQPFVRGKVL